MPTHLPYVVSLVRFYETDSAIYLQLQHAAGGRLWSYVGAYLNQCIDATANVHCNVEPRQLDCTKTDRRENHRVGTSADVGQFPTSADSLTVSTATACAEFGESDLKSKLSLSDVDSMDDSREPIDRKVSVASSPECLSQGFGEVLLSSNQEIKYFRIDSHDSSEQASRQLSGSSLEDNFCHIHMIATSSGICRFCSEAETPRPAALSSDSGTDSREETSIYDACHGDNVDKIQQPQEAARTVCHPSDSSTDSVTGHALKVGAEVDQSWRSPVTRSSRERSFDSCGGRRRHRTLSSAFGELDLAAITAANSSAAAPLRPIAHLPESCIQQWAAEMVVAISRLHSMGIICRQVIYFMQSLTQNTHCMYCT